MRGYNPFTDPVEPSMKGELWKRLRFLWALITGAEALLTGSFFFVLPECYRTADVGAGLLLGLIACIFVMWRTA